MKIDGSCHCGWLTFEAFVDRDNVNVCYCNDCQKLSASAFRAVIASKETDFKLLNNKPKEFLDVSVSATVPCMVENEKIIDGLAKLNYVLANMDESY